MTDVIVPPSAFLPKKEVNGLAEINMSDVFPDNSGFQSGKTEAAGTTQGKVVTGSVKMESSTPQAQQAKTEAAKATGKTQTTPKDPAKRSFGDDLKEAVVYGWEHVVFPEIQVGLYQFGAVILQRMIFRNTTTPPNLNRNSNIGSIGHTKYDGMFRGNGQSVVINQAPQNQPAAMMSTNEKLGIGSIYCQYRQDAENVLQELRNTIDSFGRVTLDALYQCIGRTAPSAAYFWGWRNLDDARIVAADAGSGVYLVLPEVVSMK